MVISVRPAGLLDGAVAPPPDVTLASVSAAPKLRPAGSAPAAAGARAGPRRGPVARGPWPRRPGGCGGPAPGGGLTVTLHFRKAPEHEGWVLAFIELLARQSRSHGGAETPGTELRPPLDVDKGTMVRSLVSGAGCLRARRCRPPPPSATTSDDLPAFAALATLRRVTVVHFCPFLVWVALVDAPRPTTSPLLACGSCGGWRNTVPWRCCVTWPRGGRPFFSPLSAERPPAGRPTRFGDRAAPAAARSAAGPMRRAGPSMVSTSVQHVSRCRRRRRVDNQAPP